MIAGGGNPSSGTVVGTASISAPVDGKVTIKISLTGGARFYHIFPEPFIPTNYLTLYKT